MLDAVLEHNRAEFFGIELSDIVRRADDFTMIAIAHTGEGRMQDNRKVMEPSICPDPFRERKAIHGRHFDIA